MPPFSLDDFRAALLTAAREGFAALQRSHADERFYAFALYTTDEADYVVPTANTEEGLARRAAHYAERYGGDPALRRASLRWSPADWAYHEDAEAGERFRRVDRLLMEADAQRRRPPAAVRVRGVLAACVDVLQALDREGAFGRGPARDEVVVNLLKGDQSDEERLAWARQLNPPASFARYEAELKAGHEAFRALSG